MTFVWPTLFYAFLVLGLNDKRRVNFGAGEYLAFRYRHCLLACRKFWNPGRPELNGTPPDDTVGQSRPIFRKTTIKLNIINHLDAISSLWFTPAIYVGDNTL